MNINFFLPFCLLVGISSFSSSCKQDPKGLPDVYEEKAFPVYGPFRVYKLPIEKGVKVVNPVQVSLGPKGMTFAANQSGKIYTLHDSNGDGLEDKAVLYPYLSVITVREFLAHFSKSGYFIVFEQRPLIDLENRITDWVVSHIVEKAIGRGFNLIGLAEIVLTEYLRKVCGPLFQVRFNKNF
jgi:hypothetical protein